MLPPSWIELGWKSNVHLFFSLQIQNIWYSDSRWLHLRLVPYFWRQVHVKSFKAVSSSNCYLLLSLLLQLSALLTWPCLAKGLARVGQYVIGPYGRQQLTCAARRVLAQATAAVFRVPENFLRVQQW